MRDKDELEIFDFVNKNHEKAKEMRIHGGTVRNAQPETIRRSKKAKPTKISAKLKLTVISIAIVGGLFVGGISLINNKPSAETIVIPDGYTIVYTPAQIYSGNTVESIAERYYNDLYAEMYGSLNNFIEAIKEDNNLNYKADIKTGNVLNIPALADENNEYLIKIAALEEQIAEYSNSNPEKPYWVDYKVKLGDSLLGIAARASGTTNETYKLKDAIISKNSLSNTNIYEGQRLKIINPELGPLKLELEDLKLALHESLKNDQPTK